MSLTRALIGVTGGGGGGGGTNVRGEVRSEVVEVREGKGQRRSLLVGGNECMWH